MLSRSLSIFKSRKLLLALLHLYKILATELSSIYNVRTLRYEGIFLAIYDHKGIYISKLNCDWDVFTLGLAIRLCVLFET